MMQIGAADMGSLRKSWIACGYRIGMQLMWHSHIAETLRCRYPAFKESLYLYLIIILAASRKGFIGIKCDMHWCGGGVVHLVTQDG